MYSLGIAQSFKKLFAGNEESYGEYIKENIDTDTLKEKGKYSTKKGVPQETQVINHLSGRVGLGIVPLMKNNRCNFSVIDVDNYKDKEKIHKIIDIIYDYDIPLFPFKSKSGGLHLYIFWESPVKADIARDYLKKFLNIFGLSKNTEIFPKQISLENNRTGSWINLPYFGGDKDRFLYKKDKTNYQLIEMINKVENNKTSTEDLDQFFETLVLLDAPPCLQCLYIKNDTAFRNNYLFSLTCYYKAKYGDSFEKHIIDANNRLSSPLPIEELYKSIISSHKKKSYSYKCSDAPLLDLCDKKECRQRKFGIGGVSNLSFEELTQHKTDPPYYTWLINGKELIFYNEMDIINQSKFREQCFRELHILPVRLTDIKWTAIVNTALTNVVIKDIDPEDDISPGMLFKEYLVEFFEHRALAKNKEQILIDRVYKDIEKKSYIFKPKNLIAFLVYQKQFKYFGKTEVQVRLKKMKGGPVRYFISKEVGAVRAWALPFSSLGKFNEKRKDINIEYNKEDIFNEEYY